MNIEELASSAHEQNMQRDQEIERINKRIRNAEARIEKLRREHAGPMEIVEKIATEIAERMPDRKIETYGPFGLGNEMTIHVCIDGKAVASIVMRPGKNGQLVEIDKTSNTTFAPGTLGAVNGLGRRQMPLTGTIDQLVERLRSEEIGRAS